jgi:hypothetical protein
LPLTNTIIGSHNNKQKSKYTNPKYKKYNVEKSCFKKKNYVVLLNINYKNKNMKKINLLTLMVAIFGELKTEKENINSINIF